MFTFLLWCVLFVVCWPLALLALVAYPFVWLILLPFRLVGVAVRGVLEVVYMAITLPFRLLDAGCVLARGWALLNDKLQ